jgi:hypothetical protein
VPNTAVLGSFFERTALSAFIVGIVYQGFGRRSSARIAQSGHRRLLSDPGKPPGNSRIEPQQTEGQQTESLTTPMAPQAAPYTNFSFNIHGFLYVRDVGVVGGKFSFHFQSRA